MQKSIFARYFSIFSSLVLICIFIMGIVIFVASSQYFKNEKYDLLLSSVNSVCEVTDDGVNLDDTKDKESENVLNDIKIIAHTTDSQIFITDANGNVIMCTESQPCIHSGTVVNETILNSIDETNIYRAMGSMENIYKSHNFAVGKAMFDKNGNLTGYVFAVTPVGRTMSAFLFKIAQMFLIASLIVLCIVFVIVYAVTLQMVKPLKEMSEATKKFANGDFSARIAVTSYDEMGALAMSLNNMAQSLSSLETMRRSFISNVSHELKTPMTTIGGFIDGILDGTIPQSEQRRYMRIVSDEVKRMSGIVRTMLDLSRIEAGETKLNCKRFDMVEAICQTLFSLEGQIEAKGLDIRGLDHDKVFVNADENLTKQVIYNLTENAIKFANEGGYIEFSFNREGSKYQIGIKNSGKGLSKSEIPKVFDRFYKTDRSRSLDKSGVGLGLYIVKSIVNLHDGDIMVKSVEGSYCEFIFSLPAVKIKDKLKKN